VKPEKLRGFGSPVFKWEENINMDLTGTDGNGVN
jgi:hypothetical protein